MQEIQSSLIKHLALKVGALFVQPASQLIIRDVEEGFSRLILIIVDDLSVVGFGYHNSPIGIGGLHCSGLDHNVIGSILEVSVDHAEVCCLQIHCQGVISIGIVIIIDLLLRENGTFLTNRPGGHPRFSGRRRRLPSLASQILKCGCGGLLGCFAWLCVRGRNDKGVDFEGGIELWWIRRSRFPNGSVVTAAAVAALFVEVVVIINLKVPVPVQLACIVNLDGTILEADLKVVG